MNVLSLFAGIGGLDLGLERAGLTVVGQVEIDPYCQQVLAKHWPEVPRHDDIRTCVNWWLGEPRPPVDVVAGGFPCQPVSVAGRRRAQADERWLWPAAAAVIRDLRPGWAVLENVPGLLSRGMGDVLGDLAEIGYDAEWDCIPAAAVGAPHRRDRVFVVAYPSGQPRRLQPVPQPQRGRTSVVGNDGADRRVADTAGDRREGRPELPARRNAVSPAGPVRADSDRCGTPAVADADRAGLEGSRIRGAAAERGPVADADSVRLDRRRGPLVGDAGHADDRRARTGWGPPTADPWWASEPDVGRVAHGVPHRVDRLRTLGNAVVPQVAEHIGRLLIQAAA